MLRPAAEGEKGGPAGYADAIELSSGQQYIYQDQAQLGYPVWNHAYLDDLKAAPAIMAARLKALIASCLSPSVIKATARL